MEKPTDIVIASKNPHKIVEIEEAFKHFNIKVKSLEYYPNAPKVLETGSTFEQNATLKATQIMAFVKNAVIADDSGLVVPSIGGEPGVYSARYAGDHDDAANNRKLLSRLADKNDRKAYFQTVLVYLTPAGDKVVVSGTINGEILKNPRGHNGFGYDPYFYVPEKQKTLAELSVHEKNEISHRGKAIKALVAKLENRWSK